MFHQLTLNRTNDHASDGQPDQDTEDEDEDAE